MSRFSLLPMTLVSCLVRIGGDLNHVTQPSSRGFGPGVVSWPEVLVLREVHGGDDAVEAIRAVGEAQTTPAAEKARLVRIYGGNVPEALFPGANPRMDLEMPEEILHIAGLGAEEDDARDTLMVPAFTLNGERRTAAVAARQEQQDAEGLQLDPGAFLCAGPRAVQAADPRNAQAGDTLLPGATPELELELEQQALAVLEPASITEPARPVSLGDLLDTGEVQETAAAAVEQPAERETDPAISASPAGSNRRIRVIPAAAG